MGALDDPGPKLPSAIPGFEWEFLHRSELQHESCAANWFDWLQLAFAANPNRMSDGRSTRARKTNSDGHKSRVHFRRLLGNSSPTALVTDPPGSRGSNWGFSVESGSARKVYVAHDCPG